MNTFVLILYVYISGVGVSTTTQEFTSSEYCNNAKKQIEEQWNSALFKKVSTICVEK